MRTKKDSIGQLLDGIERAAREREFDIVADLKMLLAQYGYTGRKAYGNLLKAMIAKYETEDAQIHRALAEKAKSGDLEAIRLYGERRTAGGSGDGVVIQDDIG